MKKIILRHQVSWKWSLKDQSNSPVDVDPTEDVCWTVIVFGAAPVAVTGAAGTSLSGLIRPPGVLTR